MNKFSVSIAGASVELEGESPIEDLKKHGMEALREAHELEVSGRKGSHATVTGFSTETNLSRPEKPPWIAPTMSPEI